MQLLPEYTSDLLLSLVPLGLLNLLDQLADPRPESLDLDQALVSLVLVLCRFALGRVES